MSWVTVWETTVNLRIFIPSIAFFKYLYRDVCSIHHHKRHVYNFKYLRTCTREHVPCMILSELLLNLTTVLSDSLVVLGFLHYLGSQFLSLLEHPKFCLFDLNCRKSFLCLPPSGSMGASYGALVLLHWNEHFISYQGYFKVHQQ